MTTSATKELGNTLGNNLADICLLVTTEIIGKPLKPFVFGFWSKISGLKVRFLPRSPTLLFSFLIRCELGFRSQTVVYPVVRQHSTFCA